MNEHTETILPLSDSQAIERLVSVLAEYGCSEGDYSLGGYAEMKVCMENAEDGEWEVFVGERAWNIILTRHPTVESARNQMIDLLVSDEVLYKEMKESLLEQVKDI